MDAGGGAEEGAFGDEVEASLEGFGGAAAVDVQMVREGAEGEGLLCRVEEGEEGVGFEVDAGGADGGGAGAGGGEDVADGGEEGFDFARVPEAPFAAVDGVADLDGVGPVGGAGIGEFDEGAPGAGGGDGTSGLEEGEGDRVAGAAEFAGAVEGPVPVVGAEVVVVNS